MAEIVGGVLGRNNGEGFGKGLLEGCDGTGLKSAQRLFNLRPTLFDRVEVGRVGRQVAERGSGLFDEFSYAIDFMSAQIVHDNQLARFQLRTKDIFQISQEDIAVGGGFNGHSGHPAGNTDRAQYRQCAPAAGWNPLFDARALQRATIAPGHFRGDAALIDEDELRRIDLSGFPLPELALRFDSITVLLGGVE